MKTWFKWLQFGMACAAVGVLVAPARVSAQYQGEVGTGEVTVDKKIRSFSDNLVADNFDKSQKVFVEGETIEFIVMVENTSSEDLENVKVTDKLPIYLKLLFYPGTYNADTNTIEWTIDKLASGESKKFNIRGTIEAVPAGYTSSNPKLMENVAYSVNDKDTAKYYVANKTVPTTGDVDLIVKTGILVMTGLSGWSLRKFSRGY